MLLSGKQGDAVQGDGCDDQAPEVPGHGGDHIHQRGPVLHDDPACIEAVDGADGQGRQRQAEKAEPFCFPSHAPEKQIQTGCGDGTEAEDNPHNRCAPLLGDMGVVGDVLGAVAVVALAPGAVAELQIGEIHIGAAADGALVGVGGLDLGMSGLVAARIVEGDGLAAGMDGLSGGAVCVDPPGDGEQIFTVSAKGQEVVAQGDEGEEIVGEEVEDTQNDDEQIKQRQIPGLHGNDEKQGKLGIGVEGGIGQEQAQVQIVGAGHAAEDQAVHVHQQDSGEVEQIEPEGAPEIFNGPSQGVVAQEHQGGPEDVAGEVQEYVAEQPPDLTLEDQTAVKIEPVGDHAAGIDGAQKIHRHSAQGDVKHQIGDALVAVSEAEPVEIPAQIFHGDHLVKSIGTILPVGWGKVHRGNLKQFA